MMRRIGLGFACNNACVFCAQGDLRAGGDTIDEARVAGLIEAVKPGEIVAFTGGEPTIHERLPAWIEAASARGARRVLVQTNGRRLAYPAYAKVLKEACPSLTLEVSLHGSTEPMHDYHTSVPGSFKQTRIGLKNARSLGIASSITTVVTRSNFRHLAEIVAVAHGAGARAVRFATAEPFGRAAGDKDRVIPAWELVRPHLVHAAGEAKRLGLGVAAGDRASSPDVLERFAGLGEVEAPGVSSSCPEGEARRVSLNVLGRPAPGRQEIRAHARRSGDDLKAIFPALFEAGGGAG
ncbi:MAG: radical SAM protein [Polyangiaceae bacterium]|nr:radical SAM protein [Polyangiaceae bacterium]